MNEFLEGIQAVLKTHPLSQKILQFLIDHETAMDTIDGVAKCWVNSDPIAVKSVLESLHSAGAVMTHVLNSGTYYRLTPDTKRRAWLKANRSMFQVSQTDLSACDNVVGQ